MLRSAAARADLHRQAAWPANRPVSSSVSRAKHHPGGVRPAQTLGLMTHPNDTRRETEARYRALQSGALVSFLGLLLVAGVSNFVFPSSPWFLLACALGGAFISLSWHLQATQPERSSALYPIVGVAVSVLGLLFELERPLLVNLVCGYSLLGAVMFGCFEVARRRQS